MVEMYPLQGSGELVAGKTHVPCPKVTADEPISCLSCEHYMECMTMNNLKQTISACLIVKDEEEMLPRCLDSIMHVVNQIIVIDTGSTDRTIAIADEYNNADVSSIQWHDDFSAARNYAIAQATSEWVLIIDADEELTPESAPKLREWMQNTRYDAIAFHILNETPSGWGKMQSPRLFRRDAVHYEGIIHNLAIVEGEIVLSDLVIKHYGYNLSPEKMTAKYDRSKRLLLKAIAEKPTARLYQHLIRLYRVTEKHVELSLAVDEYKAQFGDMEGDMAEIRNQMISVDLTYSMITQKRYDEAIEEGIGLLNEYPRNVDACYYMGMAFMSRGEFFKAATYFGLYLTWIEQMKSVAVPTPIIVDTWGAVPRAHFLIAECHKRRGNLLAAHEAYLQAYRLKPHKECAEAMGLNMNQIELLQIKI